MSTGPEIDIVIEAVRRRAFAVAVDWPGWTRSGRDEDAALDALLRAGPRYAAVATAAGIGFAAPADRSGLTIVDHLPGNSGTEYGVPSVPLAGDEEPVDEAWFARQAAILQAAWEAFDGAVARHADAELSKGPRGGGRDLPAIVGHVEEADRVYLVQLGARPPKGPGGPAPISEIHAAALATLRARVMALPVENASRVAKPWSPRRYVRRAAWHALDHAWEIEDRAILRA